MIFEVLYVKRVYSLVEKRDEFRIKVISVRQVLLGIFDLFRVVYIGLLGALSIDGVQSRERESRIFPVLRIPHLENLIFQTRSGCFGRIAMFQLQNERACFLDSKPGIIAIRSDRSMKNWAN